MSTRSGPGQPGWTLSWLRSRAIRHVRGEHAYRPRHLLVHVLTPAFSKLAKRVGLAHWHPHELRQSGASLMPAPGTPLHVVPEILGHTGITVTKDVQS
ncbi:tyrosine-type recombinase/integrase [Actinomadura sp. NPDC000600]|uniref:tyrosine-type recombinase/integrase n=1 Tax=Actinomadura sp. NPDC000600 TaxID=3154262 RepID=UPI003390B1AC